MPNPSPGTEPGGNVAGPGAGGRACCGRARGYRAVARAMCASMLRIRSASGRPGQARCRSRARVMIVPGGISSPSVICLIMVSVILSAPHWSASSTSLPRSSLLVMCEYPFMCSTQVLFHAIRPHPFAVLGHVDELTLDPDSRRLAIGRHHQVLAIAPGRGQPQGDVERRGQPLADE